MAVFVELEIPYSAKLELQNTFSSSSAENSRAVAHDGCPAPRKTDFKIYITSLLLVLLTDLRVMVCCLIACHARIGLSKVGPRLPPGQGWSYMCQPRHMYAA